MDPPLPQLSLTQQPPFIPTSAAGASFNDSAHHASSQPPSTIPAFSSHPPYAEMIYAAITALKDPEGSSKRAIAKYIETAYSGLPPAHPALLTHHLKRLKNNGLLLMVKKSYKLPRSDTDTENDTLPVPANTTPSPVNNDPTPLPLQNFLNESSLGLKRGRGRPPKPKPTGIAPTATPVVIAPPNDTGVAFSGGGSTIDGSGVVDHQVMTTPVVADQQDHSVVKRGRGRPKKLGLGLQVGGVGVKRGRGRPPKSVGRPRKPKSVSSINGIKRSPGRPRKNNILQPLLSVPVPYAATSQPIPAPAPGADTTPAAAAAGVDGAAVSFTPRPRGRPRKNAPLASSYGAMVTFSQKRPGRPPGSSTGRPVGRPRKADGPSSLLRQQAEAYVDACRKLEFFQTRVMHAVSVLKPYFTNESSIDAIIAIQEMEGLASMDVRVPFKDESQLQPQPQPQPQPQSQPQHQPQFQPQHPQPAVSQGFQL